MKRHLFARLLWAAKMVPARPPKLAPTTFTLSAVSWHVTMTVGVRRSGTSWRSRPIPGLWERIAGEGIGVVIAMFAIAYLQWLQTKKAE